MALAIGLVAALYTFAGAGFPETALANSYSCGSNSGPGCWGKHRWDGGLVGTSVVMNTGSLVGNDS